MMNERARDDGFTLIELLMVIAMTGIILTALVSAFTVGLQNTNTTGTRLAESADVQLLSTYLPPDVQNAGSLASDVSTGGSATAGCSGSLTGSNVLALQWSDPLAGTAYGVTYRAATVGGERQLIRYACTHAATTSTVIARSLATSGAVADITLNPRITMTLTLASGYTGSVTAVRRSVLLVAASASPTPPACVLTSAVLSPSAGDVTLTGTLLLPPTLTVTLTGPCGTISTSYQPDGSTPRSQTLVGTTTRTALLTATGWTAGDRPLTLLAGATSLGIVPFVVTAAPVCSATSVSLSPAQGSRSKNPSPNTLSEGQVTVSAMFATSCGTATLVYDPSDSTTAPSAHTTAFAPAAGASRTATIAATTKWSDGPHTLLIKDSGGAITSTTFTVTAAACTVTSVTLSPASVNNNSNGINQSVDVTVKTAGVCSALKVQFTPGSTSTTLPLTETIVGSGTWQATIDEGASYSWTDGDKIITAQLSDGTSLSPTATLQVK